MEESTRDLLNRLYLPIAKKAQTLRAALDDAALNRSLHGGFYNGHYHRDADGQYRADAYPIYVLEVRGLCDLEIDFDGVTVTTKLSREQAERFDWRLLGNVPFAVYGVERYLTDCGDSRDPDAIRNGILSSAETEFFVSFSFPSDLSGEEAARFVGVLQQNSFYY